MGRKPEAQQPSDDDSRVNGGGMDKAVSEWKRGNFAQLSEYFKRKGWDTHIKIVSVLLVALAVYGYKSGLFEFERA